tara:strand:+ start:105 stop:545 length:441 start_codon:yes stop_codon:yes gene_type:complete
MRRLLNATAAFAVLAAASLTASADHHQASSCKPAQKCCQAKKSSCFSLPKLRLPKLELPKLSLPKLDLFGCSKSSHTCCKTAVKHCSGGLSKSAGEETKAPKVEDAPPPPPYEGKEKAPAPAPPKKDTKAEAVKKAAPAAAPVAGK